MVCRFAVMLRMSIYSHAQNVDIQSCSETQASLICALHQNVNGGWRCFLAMEDGKDNMTGPSHHYVFDEVKCRNKFWMQPTAANSKEIKAKKPVHCSFVLFFGLPLNQQCTISDTCSIPPPACGMYIDTLADGTAWGIIRLHTLIVKNIK